jgi:hypothetical protein
MNLINELQESCEKDDVLTVLRKTKRLSAKLERKDIIQWVNNEQNGYKWDSNKKMTEQLPEYRCISVSLAYNTNGYIPAGFGQLMKGTINLFGWNFERSQPVCYSMPEILTWIESIINGNGIYVEAPKEIADNIRNGIITNFPQIKDQIVFLSKLDSAEIRSIPEKVKDKILDWACDLESAGIKGDGISFNDKEKNISQDIILKLYQSFGTIKGDVNTNESVSKD